MIDAPRRVPVLLVAAVLLLIAGICAGDQTRLTPHFESSEACGGFTQCSVLVIALIGLALPWIAGAYFITTTPKVRSTPEDPIFPPPELLAFSAA